MNVKVLVTLLGLTLCDPMDCIAHQAPQSMGFSRQEHWSGLRFPPPADLPDPGMEPRSPALQVDYSPSEPPAEPDIDEWREEYMIDSRVIYWMDAAAAAAKSLQSCPTLCDPIDGSPPGFLIPRILQARTLEWVLAS